VIEVGLRAELQPPMANGEVIFEAPWQSRVFGMAVALSEAGLFTWAEFQQHLIAVIGAWDEWAGARRSGEVPDYRYYELFSQALVDLLTERALVDEEQLHDLTQAFLERPHGHDH